MAQRHIALLRGINVGKAKRVAMADLRAVLEGAGFTDVATLLQSGNVVFAGRGSAKAFAAKMEKAFLDGIGFSSKFTVLPASELDAILEANPFPAHVAEPSRLHVGFLADASVRTKLEPVASAGWGVESVALGGRVIYLHTPAGQAKSPLSEAIARAARDQITVRNWATLTKLQALAGSAK